MILFPKKAILLVLTFGAVGVVQLAAQATTMSHGSFDFNTDGVVFQSSDSNTRVLMRFRMQNWAIYTTERISPDDDLNLSAGSIELTVRRLRLRFGGSLVDPRLTFNLQLSFSRNDMDWSDTQFPNIIRDAMLFWNFSPSLQVGFGQTKLPGNRQRVISSGDIEIADRSIVNGAFNLDRDFGFQGFWRPLDGAQIVNLRAAVSSGDGRNQPSISGGGLAYTGRLEWLPLGAFTNGGDYFEGDLAGESSPKVSVGLSFQHNEDMLKTRGTLGTQLYQRRSAQVLYADGLFKYSGFALYCEYAQRACNDPVTQQGDLRRAVFTGSGYLIQPSYVFPFLLSIAGRYAVTKATDQLKGLPEFTENQNIAANVGYYINRHRIKVNLEFGQNTVTNLNDLQESYTLYSRFNMEFGI